MSSMASEPATPSSGWTARARKRADVLVLGALGCVAVVIYYVAGHGMTFFFDEWDFILGRGGDDAAAFLSPHNGHLVLVPVLVYKALWSTVGIGQYGPYRLIDFALHVTCVALLFVFVRRRVGGAVAVIAATSLLFLGPAWQDLLWPFQIGYLGSIAAGLGAALELERGDRRGDIAAALLLALSIACSGLGLPFLVGAGVYLLLKRRSWPRLAYLAIPVVPYAAWYLHYGQNEASSSNASSVPSYVFDSFSGGVGAISSLGTGHGKILAVLVLVAVAAAIALRRPWLSALPFVAIALAFWGLTALSRAQLHEPDASRYLYPSAVMIILVVAELLRGVRFRPALVVLLSAALIVATAYNLRTLRNGANGLRDTDSVVAAELAAVELEKAIVPADFRPDTARAPQISAGPYLTAVRELDSSPALPKSELAAQSPTTRLEVDRVLAAVITPTLVSRREVPTAGKAPPLEGYGGGTLVRHNGCLAFDPRSGGLPPSLDVVVPPTGLVVRSSGKVDIRILRFADAYPESPSTALKPGIALLRPPRDAASEPWRIRFTPSTATTICAAR